MTAAGSTKPAPDIMNKMKRLMLKLIASLPMVLAAWLPMAVAARDLIEPGNATVWRYRDDGQEPPAAWRDAAFDDSQWKSGKAPLGYGRTGLGTEVGWGTNAADKFITTWFRHEFNEPELKPGERLVINFCVDDGAVIYLNGQEVGRANLPEGPLNPSTLAPDCIGVNEEGRYLRMPVPVADLHPGRNVFAVEVHQCSPKSHDIFLDFELKTEPPEMPTPPVPAQALAAVKAYLRQNYVGPQMSIPDGYEDGGHAMRLKGQGPPVSGREILLVDRANDVELAKELAFAHSPGLLALPPLERARQIAIHIDKETTPLGGMRGCDSMCEQLEKEFKNQPVRIGDWVDQGHAGVCRHRALLFKILGDEAGLKVALVRGHLVYPAFPEGDQHAWNELFLDDGRRLLVDVMNIGSKANYQEVTAPVVVKRYRKHDNSAWYAAVATVQ